MVSYSFNRVDLSLDQEPTSFTFLVKLTKRDCRSVNRCYVTRCYVIRIFYPTTALNTKRRIIGDVYVYLTTKLRPRISCFVPWTVSSFKSTSTLEKRMYASSRESTRKGNVSNVQSGLRTKFKTTPFYSSNP